MRSLTGRRGFFVARDVDIDVGDVVVVGDLHSSPPVNLVFSTEREGSKTLALACLLAPASSRFNSSLSFIQRVAALVTKEKHAPRVVLLLHSLAPEKLAGEKNSQFLVLSLSLSRSRPPTSWTKGLASL